MNPQLKHKLNIINPLNFTEMKNLGKLSINPEKVMKNEELLRIRGGYENCWNCQVSAGGGVYFWETWCGPDLYTTQGACAVEHNAACYCI
jgi:hypothetical protein